LTEDDAREWIARHFDVSRETLAQLDAYADTVRGGQESQNLVSASTIPEFWSRHIVDSAQLILLGQKGSWLDIGSGAGIPGIVIAILNRDPVILVEPRARRAIFLQETGEKLGLSNVRVVQSTVQKLVANPVDNIAARAVAALPALVEMAMPHAHKGTIWVLPKGKSAESELASLPHAWQGGWTIHRSVTDPDSNILVGRNVKVNGKK
jgi:16S rRNA (guanine527-N7)-methyltransferase